jgi:HlyD family secretion protein
MRILTVFILTLFFSCKRQEPSADASGTFESNEVIISSLANGRILSLNIDEGSVIAKDSVVGTIDRSDLALQKEEVEASITSLQDQTATAAPQVKLLENQLSVQQSQVDNLLHEKQRTENLIRSDAATRKQLDDINAQIEVLRRQMSVTRQQIDVQKSNVGTQNKAVLSHAKPLEKKVAQLEEQLSRTTIINPVAGTVLVKYAEAGEVTSTGKALYKVADLSVMTLRAYITGSQLSRLKLDQAVKLRVDDGAKKYREYQGTITWISDKAEFTPKTIQTKEERANLVYGIKVTVKNDGFLKIGMYGEVIL